MRQFWNSETFLWVSLVVAVLLTAGAGRFNVWRMESSEQVLQSTRVTFAELTALQADINEAETGQRGYILTGQDEFLAPYRQADGRVWERLIRIREQVVVNPKQLELLADVEKLIRGKFEEMRRIIDLNKTKGREAAATAVSVGEGKRIMDSIRLVVKDMLAGEEARLEERAKVVDTQYRIAKFTNILAAVLSIAILVGLAVNSRQDERRRGRLSDKLGVSKGETDEALARLDAFFRHAPYGIAYLDPDLRFLRVNETLAREHGLPVRDHVGRLLTELLPQFPPDLLADYRKVQETEHGFIQRHVQGAGLVWDLTVFAVPDTDGRRGLGIIGLNVTDRYRQEEKLRQSEERLRRVFESNVVGMIRWDIERSLILDANAEFFRMTGYTRDDVTGGGLNFRELTPPEWTARNELGVDTIRADGHAAPYEKEYFRKDGSRVTLIIAGTRFDDSPTEGMSFLIDISEMKQAEDRLAASEERLRLVVESATGFAIFTMDTEGAIDGWNAGAARLFGYAEAEVVGQHDRLLYTPEDAEQKIPERELSKAGADGRAVNERWHIRKDGSLFWGSGLVQPLRAGGGVVGFLKIMQDMTDAQLAEERLRQSEERFRAMADGIPQLAWMTHPDGHIFWYNYRWYDYTGTTLADMEGWGWEKVHDPVELPRVKRNWTKALAAGEAFEDTFPLRRHDGQMRWHLTRAIPSKNADGTVLLWFGTNTDITQQREAEQALRASVGQLRQLTEGMPLLMWACQPTGECDYLSQQWVEFTGVPEAEQQPYGWLDALHPDDRAGTAEAWQAATDEKKEYDVEFRIRRHDGVHRWFAVRGIPLRDEQGHIVRWYGSCTDIDERKRQATTLEKMVIERTASLHRMNTALREQQIFLDAILNNVAEGIAACDGEGKLKLFNAATTRMHGLPIEPLPPEQWADHYRLYEADGVAPMPADRVPLMRAWRGEAVQDAEMLIRTPDGADRYVLCSGVQLQAADGTSFGAVVSMRDMTERREYERQLLVTAAALEQAIEAYRVSNEALLASNAELEKFAYIASHDLQEPLRKIQAFGTRLAGKYRDTLGEQGQDYLNRMLDSAGRMSRLIEDLLSFSRVASKSLPMATVNLNTLVGDVLKDLELRVQQSGGRVEVGTMPSVKGDASQLRQVFQNLIGNALKFARPGVTPVVKVLAVPFEELAPYADPPRPAGGGWRIRVEDNGIGFEQGYAERIFELFQRLHARAEYEGTGLGLAIVRKIVLRHGAAIAARGKPGEGAAFLIDWPLRALNTT